MTMLEAVRSRLGWIAIVIVAAALGAAQFLSQVALIEANEIQAALVGAVLRAAGVFMVASFVITSMVREANDRVTELLLSQPVPRWVYLAGKFCGYAVIVLVLAFAFAVPLGLLGSWRGAALWGASFACEMLIVSAVSLFCVVIAIMFDSLLHAALNLAECRITNETDINRQCLCE